MIPDDTAVTEHIIRVTSASVQEEKWAAGAGQVLPGSCTMAGGMNLSVSDSASSATRCQRALQVSGTCRNGGKPGRDTLREGQFEAVM